MCKQQRDKNHEFIRRLKRDIMRDIIHCTQLNLHTLGVEVSENNISQEYVRRLKNELKGLGFIVDVHKTRYTYQLTINWEHLKG